MKSLTFRDIFFWHAKTVNMKPLSFSTLGIGAIYHNSPYVHSASTVLEAPLCWLTVKDFPCVWFLINHINDVCCQWHQEISSFTCSGWKCVWGCINWPNTKEVHCCYNCISFDGKVEELRGLVKTFHDVAWHSLMIKVQVQRSLLTVALKLKQFIICVLKYDALWSL